MTGIVPWLALSYVALLPLGRSGLPLNAQWGDVLLPLLVLGTPLVRPGVSWWRREDWPLAFYLGVTLVTAIVSPDPSISFGHLAKQMYVAAVFVIFRG